MINLLMKSSKKSNNVAVHPTKTTRAYWPVIVSVLFLLGLWYFITEYTSLINPLFLPSPVKVITSAISLAQGSLALDIFATVLRVMVAFIISIIVALPTALLMSESKFFKRLLTPYIDFIRYIPVPVLIPLTILFFGIGEEAKIVLLFVGTFFQIVLLFDSNLMNVPKDYFDLAYSLNFTTFQRLKMKLQAAIPEMYDNMRISFRLSFQEKLREVFPIQKIIMADIKVQKIYKSYDSKKVLENISFDVKEGEIVSILGLSVCGKITLLKCILGLEIPDDGNILIDSE